MTRSERERGHIRQATSADADAIAAIFNESTQRGGITMSEALLPSAQVEEEISRGDPKRSYLVLEVGDEVVAWGRIAPWSPYEAYAIAGETSMFVRLDHLRRGFGRRIKEAVIARAVELGYHHLVARVVEGNTASIELNKRLGFEIVGVQREVAFVGGRYVNVVLLQRVL